MSAVKRPKPRHSAIVRARYSPLGVPAKDRLVRRKIRRRKWALHSAPVRTGDAASRLESVFTSAERRVGFPCRTAPNSLEIWRRNSLSIRHSPLMNTGFKSGNRCFLPCRLVRPPRPVSILPFFSLLEDSVYLGAYSMSSSFFDRPQIFRRPGLKESQPSGPARRERSLRGNP